MGMGLPWKLHGMGQWTWNLSHVPSLVILCHTAGSFWSWILLLCARGTVSITRRFSVPWWSDARPRKIRTLFWVTVKNSHLISLDPLIGKFMVFLPWLCRCYTLDMHMTQCASWYYFRGNPLDGIVTSCHGIKQVKMSHGRRIEESKTKARLCWYKQSPHK